MKKKILLSSVLTIVVCLSLIAGSTFALFTHSTKVNIAATAGNVEMTAGIALTLVESVEGDPAGTIEDEYGSLYSYKYKDNTAPYNFINGGEASIAGSVLTLTAIAPGDKVTFSISGANTSDIAILYRYKIDCVSGENLMKGLVFTVNNVEINRYMETYTSPWMPLAVGTDMTEVPISIELPVTAGNEFEKEETEIRVLVEAIQGNAVVEDNTAPVITYYNTAATADDLADILADPYLPVVDIAEDLVQTIDIDLTNKTINANNHDVALTFTGNLSNVVVSGINDTNGTVGGNTINVKNASGDITIKDSTVADDSSREYGAIVVGPNVDVTIDNCDLVGIGKTYGIYNGGASGSLTIKDSTFKNFGSWAIQINNAVNGDLTIDGCTFDTPDGVLKVLSGVNGDFTFTNNTMIGCKGHDGAGEEALMVSTSTKWKPLSYTGTKTMSGNTLDGVAWAQ